MLKRVVSLAVVTAAAVAAACSDSTPTAAQPVDNGIACTMEARPGISMTVVDSLTGQAVSSSPLIAARQGTYVDTSYHFTVPATGPYGLAYERPGIYTVTVDAPGYKQWRLDNVLVAKGQCHVSTVLLTARLQK